MVDSASKLKWGAWNSTGLLSKDNDRQRNVKLVSSLVISERFNQEHSVSRSSHQKYETLQITCQDNITKIIMNRPEKKNAVSTKMYNEIIEALEDAGRDDSVLTVLTGSGDYFSSGNDLGNAIAHSLNSQEERIRDSIIMIRKFVGKFIDFPKPLIAMVNGPAIGIAVTILGLFDLVYATDGATFNTPFSQLGQCPEGCSSYTFPKIMGLGKATEVLLFNKKLTAREACDLGLVTEVFPDSTFQQEVGAKLKAYASLPKNGNRDPLYSGGRTSIFLKDPSIPMSLTFSKQLIRGVEKEKLHTVCDQECELLTERASSDESINAILSFFKKKAKL
ncbi:enoyl-CoA delta isomerase 2-like isoform X1 [Ascaphus truei]|uniref:enoyl-CoA delta isomerase 2-like isoform X1 n=1 Tax=Ascaphus truei TaxID=8439 RepID=UPI003F5AC9B4